MIGFLQDDNRTLGALLATSAAGRTELRENPRTAACCAALPRIHEKAAHYERRLAETHTELAQLLAPTAASEDSDDSDDYGDESDDEDLSCTVCGAVGGDQNYYNLVPDVRIVCAACYGRDRSLGTIDSFF
jgi:hypothetical protein